MNFYTIKDVKDGDSIPHKGLPVTYMIKAFDALGNRDMASIDDFVFLESPYKFTDTTVLDFHKSDKSLTFGLLKPNTIFEFEDNTNHFFAVIYEGNLRIQSNKVDLENILSTKSVTTTDPIEAKALYWLDNGRVGASSGTMCGVLFPNLRSHHKLADKVDYDDEFEINYPHDNSDFDRCMKFLEAVPEAKARLPELAKASKEWDGLVSNWEKIETLINDKKSEEAYDLIKESLGQKRKPKP
jgi:hypothetical protein